jgi:hypothetical protein
MRFFLIGLFLLFHFFGQGQINRDIWLMGYEEYDAPWYGNSWMSFQGFNKEVTKVQVDMNFDQTMATWVDTSGNLLLFTNGCHVANGQGEVLTNELNPGALRDEVCPDYGYTLEGGALFVSDPADPQGIILIHQSHREDDKVIHVRDKLYLSKFEIVEGKAQFKSQNELLIDAPMERFVVVKHGNGRDWWILCPAFLSDQWHIIHVHPDGYTTTHFNTGEGSFDMNSCGRGMTSLAISPQGNMISRWNPNCGLRLYTWDRCVGGLEFVGETFAESPVWSRWGVGSTLFSPSGKYIYANNHLNIYRLDTEGPSMVLDTLFTANNHTGTPFNQMGLGVDGIIYISQMGSDTFMSTIRQPNLKPNLVSIFPRGHSVKTLYRGTMPVYVNRNLSTMEGTPCDSLMVSVSPPEYVPDTSAILVKLVPNPSKGETYVQCTAGYVARTYQIANTAGQLVDHGYVPPDGRLDTSRLSAGWYFVYLNPFEDDMAILRLVISP